MTDNGSLASTQMFSPGAKLARCLRAIIAGKGHLSPRRSSSSFIFQSTLAFFPRAVKPLAEEFGGDSVPNGG